MSVRQDDDFTFTEEEFNDPIKWAKKTMDRYDEAFRKLAEGEPEESDDPNSKKNDPS